MSGACRESYSIYNWWKYPRCEHSKYWIIRKEINGSYGYFINRIISIFILFKKTLRYKNVRRDFIFDNIKYPFKKTFMCKITPHKFKKLSDGDNEYMCTKCYKHMEQDEYNKYIRIRKIKNILK